MPATLKEPTDPFEELEQFREFETICNRLTPHSLAEAVSDWRAYRYQRFISEAIADAVQKGNGRLIINIHPRIGKSEICSRWTPIWFLENYPSKRLILTSCGSELAEEHGRFIRNQFESNRLLSTKMSADSMAAARWNTTKGGGMIAVGMGGPIMGFGGHLIIIDDTARNWEDANSYKAQLSRVEWFNGTLYQRREPNATIVLVEHRTHPNDMSGYLIEKHEDDWKVIRMPALAEPNDILGRKVGEALCPERFTAAALEHTKKVGYKVVWDAMYQQKPSLAGRGLVYSHFIQDKNLADVELVDGLPLQFCFDFNSNPGMHCEIGQYNRKADLFTTCHEVFDMKLKTPECIKRACDLIEGIPGGFSRFPHVEVYGDRSGNSPNSVTADTDYTMIVRELEQRGVKFILCVPSANPGIKNRINSVNDALVDSSGEVHYKINPRCERLVNDLKFVSEDEEGLIDKTDQTLSHSSDAAGYWVTWIRPVSIPLMAGGRVGTLPRH